MSRVRKQTNVYEYVGCGMYDCPLCPGFFLLVDCVEELNADVSCG